MATAMPKASPGDRDEFLRMRAATRRYFKVQPPKPKILERRIVLHSAELGFLKLPVEVQFGMLDVLSSFMALCLPYWASTRYDFDQYAHWGLWNLCDAYHRHCRLIKDQLVPDGSVPVWYVLVQWSFLIGTLITLVVMISLGHGIYDKGVKLSPTMSMAVKCLCAIAAIEKYLALYIFHTHCDDVSRWLYRTPEVEYHFCFFCGAFSVVMDLVIAVHVFLTDEVTIFTTTYHYKSPPLSTSITVTESEITALSREPRLLKVQ